MASFGDLYTYNTASGVVIPQTSNIRAAVESAFRDIFKDGTFSTNPTTANGRLIEAITMLFVDVCAVNAQNANGLNISQAIGTYIDGLGGMFGIGREDGESDSSYRSRIVASASRGSGFAASIRNAISGVTGVSGVVVLDNGNADPDMLPKSNLGVPLDEAIAVDPHSVFICVKGGDSVEITKKIRNTISAGCGYTTSPEYGDAVSETITDKDTGTSFTARFYRPSPRYVKVNVKVNGTAYTGDDIIADTRAAILSLLDDNGMNATVDKNEIVSAVAAVGKNIVCSSITLLLSETGESTSYSEVEKIIVHPYAYLATGDTAAQKSAFAAANIQVSEI